MLVEHMLEPAALVAIARTRRNCSDFRREFSKPSPRVIGEFPKLKTLRRLTLELQRSDVAVAEKGRLVELLAFIGQQSRVIRTTTFERTKHFQENLKFAEQFSFRGTHVLQDSSNEFGLEADILSVEQFEQGLDPLPHQAVMPKIVSEMCSTLGELLRLSKAITFVEPYFGTRPGMWTPFLGLVKHAVTNAPTEKKSLCVLFDGSKKSAPTCAHLMNRFREELAPILPQFSAVAFKDIRENGNEAIHNRYIITELGAVDLGYGLEETNYNHRDDVNMMDETRYIDRSKVYLDLERVELVDQEVIRNG